MWIGRKMLKMPCVTVVNKKDGYRQRNVVHFGFPGYAPGTIAVNDWNFEEKFGPQKTRIMGLPGSEDSLTIG